MANATTKKINTNNQFKTVAEVADFTFTQGNTYTMQVQNSADIKIDNAIFTISNEKFTYKATSDTLYIKTNFLGCTLTILEVE
jgi:hypothetical protein